MDGYRMSCEGAGAGDGGDMAGYSFDREGNFVGSYDVNTGKTNPGAGFVSEYDKEGQFTGGYGLTETSGSETSSPGLTGPEVKSLGVGGEGIKKETPPAPEIVPGDVVPEVVPTGGESKTTPKPKKRARRPTILTEEQGLMYTSPGKRRSLLGG